MISRTQDKLFFFNTCFPKTLHLWSYHLMFNASYKNIWFCMYNDNSIRNMFTAKCTVTFVAWFRLTMWWKVLVTFAWVNSELREYSLPASERKNWCYREHMKIRWYQYAVAFYLIWRKQTNKNMQKETKTFWRHTWQFLSKTLISQDYSKRKSETLKKLI